MTANSKVIELKLTPGMKMLYIATAVGCLLFALAGLGASAEASDLKEVVPLLAGIGFFGVGGVLLLKFILRDPGRLTVDDAGFTLDAYFATGQVTWDNFEAVACKRVLGFQYLGIAVRDVDRFLATRQTMKFEHAKDEGAVMGVLKIAYLARKFSPMDTMCSVLGWSKLPDSLTPKSLLEFNKASFGFHLMLQAMWLGDAAGLARQIEAARPPASMRPLQAVPAVPADRQAQAPEPASKRCPMCAEDVRAEARICRFCRHNFEPERAAA